MLRTRLLAGALAAPSAAHACIPKSMTLFPDNGAVLLVRPTADTAAAGQVVEVERAGGPAAAGLPAGRAVLVPWMNDAMCEPVPWEGSARWMREGRREAVLAWLRARDLWVDGLPTFDVFNPGQLRSEDDGDAADAELLFGFHAAIPSTSQVERDPVAAVEPLRAWLAAHPEAAEHPHVRQVLSRVHSAASGVAVRAEPSPLAGTWRFEISRNGGPVHVLYARTSLRPYWSLPNLDESQVFPREPAGYYLDLAIRLTEAQLPPADAQPDRESGRPGNANANVRLPAVPAPDGSVSFDVWIDPLTFSGMVSDRDPELNDWLWEHLDESLDAETTRNAGQAVLRPGVSAEWTQEMRISGGRVVTLRGQRISGVAYTYLPPING